MEVTGFVYEKIARTPEAVEAFHPKLK